VSGWTDLDLPDGQVFGSQPAFAEVTSGIIMLGQVPPDYRTWPIYEQQIVSQLTLDGGYTWSVAEYVSEKALATLYQNNLELAGDGRGGVRALWSTHQWVATQEFRPDSATWSAAVPVSASYQAGIYSINMLAAGASSWLVSIKENQSTTTFRQFLSTDGGTSWSELMGHDAELMASSDRGTIISATPYPSARYFVKRKNGTSGAWTASEQFQAPATAVVHTSKSNWFALIGSDIYSSTDDGQTWKYRHQVGGNLRLALTLAADPRGTAMAVATVANGHGGYDLYSITTKTNGKSWSSPTPIHLNRRAQNDQRVSLLPVGMGMWVAAFSTSLLEFQTYLTRNDGATWEPLMFSGGGDATEREHSQGWKPRLALSGNTAVLAYLDLSTFGLVYATVPLDVPKAAAADWQLFQ
jgi:hypothetical protein